MDKYSYYPIHVIFQSISSILNQFHFINRPNEVRLDDDQVRKCKMNAARPWEREREREREPREFRCANAALWQRGELVEFTGGRYEVWVKITNATGSRLVSRKTSRNFVQCPQREGRSLANARNAPSKPPAACRLQTCYRSSIYSSFVLDKTRLSSLVLVLPPLRPPFAHVVTKWRWQLWRVYTRALGIVRVYIRIVFSSCIYECKLHEWRTRKRLVRMSQRRRSAYRVDKENKWVLVAGGRYLHSRGAAGTSDGLSKRAEKEQRRCMPIRKEERKEKGDSKRPMCWAQTIVRS